MTNPTLDALHDIDATDHAGAWAIVREAELVVPAVVENPRDPGSGRFLVVPHGELQLVVAFTSTKRIGGFVTKTRRHLKLTGAELAAAIPEGHAIVLDPGHDDGRVFLPDVLDADADAAS
ncbi:SseB family protein [Agrococcus sp. TF02-05]|uniref:SseB family protein n=1 Tax=Agrococcus sp. TF02-05 TaxID=2815211 RepID=UPI001AA1453B|nr:SseB family protein [Agrococcus sp. TF02-05]MBO1769380.1 SseB family protein [Agrococcus sp. TF02-05]